MKNAKCRVQNEIPPSYANGFHFAFCVPHSASGMAAGDGLAPPSSPSKGGVLLIRRPGKPTKWICGLVDEWIDETMHDRMVLNNPAIHLSTNTREIGGAGGSCNLTIPD